MIYTLEYGINRNPFERLLDIKKYTLPLMVSAVTAVWLGLIIAAIMQHAPESVQKPTTVHLKTASTSAGTLESGNSVRVSSPAPTAPMTVSMATSGPISSVSVASRTPLASLNTANSSNKLPSAAVIPASISAIPVTRPVVTGGSGGGTEPAPVAVPVAGGAPAVTGPPTLPVPVTPTVPTTLPAGNTSGGWTPPNTGTGTNTSTPVTVTAPVTVNTPVVSLGVGTVMDVLPPAL
jgi:hypothetical protein